MSAVPAAVVPAARVVRKYAMTGEKMAHEAWNIVGRKHKSPRASCEQMKRLVEDSGLMRHRDAGGAPRRMSAGQASRVVSAMARVRYAEPPVVRRLAGYVLYSTAYEPQELCITVSAFEAMKLSQPQFFDSVRRLVFESSRARGLLPVEPADLIHLAHKLTMLGYEACNKSLFVMLQRVPRAAHYLTLHDILTLLSIGRRVGTMPEALYQGCFARYLEVRADLACGERDAYATRPSYAQECNDKDRTAKGLPLKPLRSGRKRVRLTAEDQLTEAGAVPMGVVARLLDGFSSVPARREDAAFIVPQLLGTALEQRGGLSNGDLVTLAFGAARAQLGTDACGELLPEIGRRREAVVEGLTVPQLTKLLTAVAKLLSSGVGEERFEGERATARVAAVDGLPSVVTALAASLTSAEAAEEIRSGEVSLAFWSLAKLQYEDRLHLEGLACTLREYPNLIQTMAPQHIDKIAVALPKLKMLDNKDLLLAVCDRLFLFPKASVTAYNGANMLYALAVFKPSLHAREMADYATKVQTRFFTEAMLRSVPPEHRNVIARVLWALSVCGVEPPLAFIKTAERWVQAESEMFSSHDIAKVQEWRRWRNRRMDEQVREEAETAAVAESLPSAKQMKMDVGFLRGRPV